jgi:hypothetical protein
MLFKHNLAHRHCIPKAHYHIRNWQNHEAGLKRHGDRHCGCRLVPPPAAPPSPQPSTGVAATCPQLTEPEARTIPNGMLQKARPNFRTSTASAAAKPQNSAVLLDGDRFVVLKNRCPSEEFSILTGSATVCWHPGPRRAFRSPGRRKSRLCRDFRSVTYSNPPPAPQGVVPKKPKALIQLCFSGQTEEVGLDFVSLSWPPRLRKRDCAR